jgi:hypothetical protein
MLQEILAQGLMDFAATGAHPPIVPTGRHVRGK